MQKENSPHPLRVLAVDDEFLIALGIQEMLQEHEIFKVDAERLSKFEERLSAGEAYDIIIMDPGPLSLTTEEVVEKVAAAGAALVLSSASMPRSGHETAPCLAAIELPTVRKPFASVDLLEAISKALTPAQPEKARAVAALFEASGP